MRHLGLSCALVAHALASSPALTTYTSTTRITITTTVEMSTTTAYLEVGSSDPIARVSSQSTASSAMPYTSNLASPILNSTNSYRAKFDASPLVWNTTLAEFAQGHSQKCVWEHSVRSFPFPNW